MDEEGERNTGGVERGVWEGQKINGKKAKTDKKIYDAIEKENKQSSGFWKGCYRILCLKILYEAAFLTKSPTDVTAG